MLHPELLALRHPSFALCFGLLDSHTDSFEHVLEVCLLGQLLLNLSAALTCLSLHLSGLSDPFIYKFEEAISGRSVGFIHKDASVVARSVLSQNAIAMLL